jgi:hypothetical protein
MTAAVADPSRRRARGVARLVVWLLAAFPGIRLAAQTVDTILVENANIFDERDPRTVARWANAVHITTSPWVIRRTILLRPGEPYDSAGAIESARALRELGVFRAVGIDTLRIDGKLAVRVRTADGWSTRPSFRFSATDGDVTWALGASETNFLGAAVTIGVRYRRTPDRGALELDFLNPHLLMRNVVLGLAYRDYTDGRRTEWLVGRPFRETVAPWALQTYGEDSRERMLVFREGLLASTARRYRSVVGLRGGFALTATPRDVVRVWGDLLWRREDYAADTAGAIPDRSVFVSAGAGLEAIRVRLRVVEQFDSYARSEDIDLSQVLRVGVWAAPRAWGYPGDRAGAGPVAAGQLSTVWHRGFGVLRARGSGVFTAAGLDSGRAEVAATLASQNLARQTIILHAEAGAAERPTPGGEYDLWDTRRGPRLFGAHVFTGTRRTWLVLEDRVLVADDWLGLMGVGLAPFVEFGGAWYPGDPRRTGGNAGIALRIGPTRSARASVVEIAGGWRFGTGWDAQRWALAVRTAFRFADLAP